MSLSRRYHSVTMSVADCCRGPGGGGGSIQLKYTIEGVSKILVPSYDVTDKEAQNSCKKCYVTCATCVLLQIHQKAL